MTTRKKRKRPKLKTIWKRFVREFLTPNPNVPKKRRKKLKKEIWFGLAGVIALLALILVPRYQTNKKLKTLGYDKTEIAAIREQKLTKTLIDNQWYSEYLGDSIVNQTLNTDYTVYYTAVSATRGLNDTDFLLISRLKDKGYTETQIVNLYKSLKRWEMIPLLVFDYQYDETKYIQDCLDHEDVNSTKHFELSGNYYTYYGNALPVEDSSNVNMLVNKTYYLDGSYTPPNLEELSVRYAASGRSLASVAAEAFREWNQAGASVGVTFYVTSGYRPYDSQEQLYNSYIQSMGQEATDALSARPGFSEHQTGYTVDIAATNEDGISEYKDTLAYQWTSTNAQDYGWILRYPEGKEAITGYEFESWHYRYIGVELAKAVYNSELTYDEFWCLYLKGWTDETNKPSDSILENTFWKKLTSVNENAQS